MDELLTNHPSQLSSQNQKQFLVGKSQKVPKLSDSMLNSNTPSSPSTFNTLKGVKMHVKSTSHANSSSNLTAAAAAAAAASHHNQKSTKAITNTPNSALSTSKKFSISQNNMKGSQRIFEQTNSTSHHSNSQYNNPSVSQSSTSPEHNQQLSHKMIASQSATQFFTSPKKLAAAAMQTPITAKNQRNPFQEFSQQQQQQHSSSQTPSPSKLHLQSPSASAKQTPKLLNQKSQQSFKPENTNQQQPLSGTTTTILKSKKKSVSNVTSMLSSPTISNSQIPKLSHNPSTTSMHKKLKSITGIHATTSANPFLERISSNITSHSSQEDPTTTGEFHMQNQFNPLGNHQYHHQQHRSIETPNSNSYKRLNQSSSNPNSTTHIMSKSGSNSAVSKQQLQQQQQLFNKTVDQFSFQQSKISNIGLDQLVQKTALLNNHENKLYSSFNSKQDLNGYSSVMSNSSYNSPFFQYTQLQQQQQQQQKLSTVDSIQIYSLSTTSSESFFFSAHNFYYFTVFVKTKPAPFRLSVKVKQSSVISHSRIKGFFSQVASRPNTFNSDFEFDGRSMKHYQEGGKKQFTIDQVFFSLYPEADMMVKIKVSFGEDRVPLTVTTSTGQTMQANHNNQQENTNNSNRKQSKPTVLSLANHNDFNQNDSHMHTSRTPQGKEETRYSRMFQQSGENEGRSPASRSPLSASAYGQSHSQHQHSNNPSQFEQAHNYGASGFIVNRAGLFSAAVDSSNSNAIPPRDIIDMNKKNIANIFDRFTRTYEKKFNNMKKMQDMLKKNEMITKERFLEAEEKHKQVNTRFENTVKKKKLIDQNSKIQLMKYIWIRLLNQAIQMNHIHSKIFQVISKRKQDDKQKLIGRWGFIRWLRFLDKVGKNPVSRLLCTTGIVLNKFMEGMQKQTTEKAEITLRRFLEQSSCICELKSKGVLMITRVNSIQRQWRETKLKKKRFKELIVRQFQLKYSQYLFELRQELKRERDPFYYNKTNTLAGYPNAKIQDFIALLVIIQTYLTQHQTKYQQMYEKYRISMKLNAMSQTEESRKNLDIQIAIQRPTFFRLPKESELKALVKEYAMQKQLLN